MHTTKTKKDEEDGPAMMINHSQQQHTNHHQRQHMKIQKGSQISTPLRREQWTNIVIARPTRPLSGTTNEAPPWVFNQELRT
jgi:hypothetical protein